MIEAKNAGVENPLINDARTLSLPPESIDRIFSLHTLEHIPDVKESFKEFYRVLKPGGKAYIIVPANFYGLETLGVAINALPEDQKGNGLFGFIKTLVNGWKYARQLHVSNLGTPFGGASSHVQNIFKENNLDLRVSGGRRLDLALATQLVIEKPSRPRS